MKKILSIFTFLLCAAVPTTTFTSCDEDDVKTIINIVDMIFFQNSNELAGTAWQSPDKSFALVFEADGSGALYIYSTEETTEFTYAITTSGNANVLTLTYGDSSQEQFTVSGYEEGKSLSLTDAKGSTVTYSYIDLSEN